MQYPEIRTTENLLWLKGTKLARSLITSCHQVSLGLQIEGAETSLRNLELLMKFAMWFLYKTSTCGMKNQRKVRKIVSACALVWSWEKSWQHHYWHQNTSWQCLLHHRFVEAGTASSCSKKSCQPVSLLIWAWPSAGKNFSLPQWERSHLQMFSWSPGYSAAMGSLWDHTSNKPEMPQVSQFQCCYQKQLEHWTGAPLSWKRSGIDISREWKMWVLPWVFLKVDIRNKKRIKNLGSGNLRFVSKQ